MPRCRLHWAAYCAAALLAYPVPTLCSAEIYRWVDASGTVTYGNLPPPPGVTVTEVLAEQPVDRAALAAAERERQLSMREDKLRLQELEIAAAKRALVDFQAPPPAPAGVPCGDCAYGWYAGGWPSVMPAAIWHPAGPHWRGPHAPRNAHGALAAPGGHTGGAWRTQRR
jgi:Domain of unknown function (DUF4124)